MPANFGSSEQSKQAGRKGGKAPKRQYRFGIRDIAEAKGKSLKAVRADRTRGKFDPNYLPSLARYVTQ